MSQFEIDGDPVNIDALHQVSSDILVGSGANTFQLLTGDLLLAVANQNNDFQGTDVNGDPIGPVLDVGKKDLFVFRPNTPGDYSTGTFYMLLDEVASNFLTGVSLVEQDTLVGDVTVQAGTFLMNQGNSLDIVVFDPGAAGVGPGVTQADKNNFWTYTTLIDGSDIGLGNNISKISGLDLIETDVTLGDMTLTAGNILVTLTGNDTDTGNNNLTVTENDVFYLDVFTTGDNNTSANAYMFIEGADIDFNTPDHEIGALSLLVRIGSSNVDPTIALPADDPGAKNYVEGSGAVIIDATATVTDPDSANFDGGILRVDFTAGATVNDRLSINNEGPAGVEVDTVAGTISYLGVQIGTFNGGDSGSSPLVIRFDADATLTAVQAVLRNITYENVSGDPSPATRTVRFILTDGDGGTSNVEIEDIVITLVTDPPVAVDDAYTVDEDSVLTTGASWWDSDWQYRQQLTLAAPSSTLTDVPVLIELDPSKIDYTQVQDAGQDLRFLDADGVTLLAYEIEEWNEGGTSYVWVKVPQIDTSGTDSIWLYYGNETAPQPRTRRRCGRRATRVYHLNDDVADSTANSYNATTSARPTPPASLPTPELQRRFRPPRARSDHHRRSDRAVHHFGLDLRRPGDGHVGPDDDLLAL